MSSSRRSSANQRSPFYQALVQTNIALGIEANRDTQLKADFSTFSSFSTRATRAPKRRPSSKRRWITCCKTASIPDLVTAAKRLTIAERLYSADSVDGHRRPRGIHVRHRRRKDFSDEDDRLAALTANDLLAATKSVSLRAERSSGTCARMPRRQRHHSQKSDAAASDDFSKRDSQRARGRARADPVGDSNAQHGAQHA